MKRIFAVALAALLLCTACSAKGAEGEEPLVGGASAGLEVGEDGHVDPQLEPDRDVIEIREKLFIAQTNEIYLNYEDYLGKTVSYEGIFMTTEMEGYDPWHWVVRYGPGCCANDGTAGFEIRYDGEWPEQNDWVAVQGVLTTYDVNGWDMLVLDVVSLEIKAERGQEYVAT